MTADLRAYDLVGVGIGPFNLSLAALADGLGGPAAPGGVDALFLDAKPEFSWHPGMLIDDAVLQVPFLADLTTLVDPTSRWSFLSYLREHDRLFPFYFSERFHLPRREYDHYCRWVASSLPSCRFGATVRSLHWDQASGLFQVEYAHVATARRTRVAARNVVLGVGTVPAIPEPLAGLVGKEVFHSAEYLHALPSLDGARDVTVVGAGQSGAEVFLDLLRRAPDAGWRLRWLTRDPAFAPMEYSKIGLEHFTPDYTRYFRGLPAGTRDRLVPSQWQLYKAVSADTLAAIHDLLYERSVGGAHPDAELMPNVAVTGARRAGDGVRLDCRQLEQDRVFAVRTDRVVLATGYTARRPTLLGPIAHLVRWDSRGRYQVDADHRVALAAEVGAGLYVQNAELHTHGVGTPDLGLGAFRGATILNAITGREAYRLPRRTAFTTFGVDGPAAGASGPASTGGTE